jgi:hypothetical protein
MNGLTTDAGSATTAAGLTVVALAGAALVGVTVATSSEAAPTVHNKVLLKRDRDRVMSLVLRLV